jgi:peroxiredoxin
MSSTSRHRGCLKVKWASLFVLTFALLLGGQEAMLRSAAPPFVGHEIQIKELRTRDVDSVVGVGDKAPSFRVKLDDGKELALADLRGKVVLVNFFATWCAPCIKELPHVEKIWDAHRKRDDFAMVVIGREETDDEVQAYKKKYRYSFPMAADPKAAVYRAYARKYIPRTYLIGRDGTIVFMTKGLVAADLERLKDEVSAQLRAK